MDHGLDVRFGGGVTFRTGSDTNRSPTRRDTLLRRLPFLISWIVGIPLLGHSEVHGSARVVYAESVTAGGATLQRHWEGGGALAAIRRGGWDFVVLQEQSTRPLDDRMACPPAVVNPGVPR